MKTYEERIEAMRLARLSAEYIETEELIEVFADGDTLYREQTADDYTEQPFPEEINKGVQLIVVPLQPEETAAEIVAPAVLEAFDNLQLKGDK